MASGGIAGWRELDPPRFRSTGDPDRSPRPARRPLRNPVPGAGFALSSSNARERTARRPAPIDVETSSDSRVWHTGSGPRGRAARPQHRWGGLTVCPQSGPVDRPLAPTSAPLSTARRLRSTRAGPRGFARAAAASHLGGVASEGGGRSSRSAMVTPVRRLQRWAGHTTLPGPRCDRPRSWVSADEPGCH